MKIGKLILAVIFVFIFLLALLTAVDAIRSVSYGDVFPDNINALIWVHKPLDVPLKVLNSTAARNFFKTEKGKEIEKQINAALAAATSAPKKKTPPPTIFTKSIDGVTVYFPEIIKPAETSESEPATPEVMGKKGPEMNLDKLKKAMGAGGAAVQDMYIGLYGSPMEGMEAMASGKAMFMFAMDLGRLSMFPRMFLPMAPNVKSLPANRKPGEEETLPVAFAFYRNMLIAGDPSGIERMIHTIKGTQMTITLPPPEPVEGVEATPEKKVQQIALKPLKNSKVWQRLEKAMRPKAVFNFVLIFPNLLEQLKNDPMMKDTIEQNSAKFGLARILGLIHSNQMDPKEGLSIMTEIVFDPPSPLLSLLNQQEREMVWPKLLPDSFLYAAGTSVDNFPGTWKTAQGLLGDGLAEIETAIKNRFGVENMDAFLGILGKEVSIMSVAADGSQPTIHCDSVGPQAKDFMKKLEGKSVESAIADAEKAVEDAVSGGAETFAAEAVAKAKEALTSAKTAQGENRNVEAVVLARKAKEFAKAGLVTVMNKANAYIDAAMSAGAYTYAQDELDAAQKAAGEAKEAYEGGQPAAGTDAAKKALNLGKLALAFGKAGTAQENAKSAGADTKAAPAYAAAKVTLDGAKAAYKTGQITVAITSADLATTQFLQAQATASGGKVEPIEAPVAEPAPIDFTLPAVQSPRAAEGAEIFQSVGIEPVDYAFISADTMCYGKADEIDAFLKMPRGEAIKNNYMRALLSVMPRETQAMALINGYKFIETQGLLPDDTATMESPASTQEAAAKPKPNEIKEFVKSLNLMVGGYILSTDDSVRFALVSPIQLFDGTTGGGARSATAALFFLAKWGFYLLGLGFLYLTVRMFRKKKQQQ